jgi:hypothetical protein
MRVGQHFIKFAKTAVNSSASWNETMNTNAGLGMAMADLTFTRKETNDTTI